MGTDGLPSATLMLETLDADFKPDSADIVKLAMESCDKELRISQKALESELSEEDKCWASNAMVGCLLEKFHEVEKKSFLRVQFVNLRVNFIALSCGSTSWRYKELNFKYSEF